MTQATCRKCGQTKDASAFKPNAKLRSGIHSWCKDCDRQAVRDSRAKHGHRYNDKRRGSITARRGLNVTTLHADERAYLAAVANDPCSYCGQPATDLDHIEPAGEDNHGWENRTAACGTCNKRKQRMSVLGFLIRQRLVDDGYDALREQWVLAA